MSKYTAYIDTSILGSWILCYKKPQILPKAGKRILESYYLLTAIEKSNLGCDFISSTWATSELAGVIVDNVLSEQMIRDGIPLTEFPSQKRVFNIQDESVKRTIVVILADFKDFLESLNVKIRSFEVDDDSVIDLLFKHIFLPIPDALHLSFAMRSCDALVTLDERHFLEPKHRQEIEDSDGIKILRPSELMKHFQKLPRSVALRAEVR